MLKLIRLRYMSRLKYKQSTFICILTKKIEPKYLSIYYQSGLGHKTPLAKYLYKKKSWGGLLSKFGSKSSQISWGSQKNQIWSDRSGERWRDNDRREKVPFQALIIKEIWEKCPKMRFLLFLTRFIKLYEKLTYFIL